MPDVEELEARLEGRAGKATKSLVYTVQLWHKDKGFASVAAVSRELLRYVRQLDPKVTDLRDRSRAAVTFVLKVQARQCTDIRALNALIHQIIPLHNGALVVEASFDRLVLLARAEDSVFLMADVYPALRTYLVAGAEQHCLEELERFQRNILVSTRHTLTRLPDSPSLLLLCLSLSLCRHILFARA